MTDSTNQPPIRVLIVEDDPMLRNLLSVKFNERHFSSMFSSDGAGAADLVDEFEPDVVILDIMLPNMNGVDILEAIRKKKAKEELPVIILSNKSDEKEIERAKEIGATKYCIKAMTDLSEVIDYAEKAHNSVLTWD